MTFMQQHAPCFAHTLQLVIKDGFKQAPNINKVMKKATAIVSYVHKSISASEALESENRLQPPNAIRWNSQLTMIHSILKVQEEKLQSLDTQYELSTYDRKILQDVSEILSPFEAATNCIQGDNVVTGSMVIHVPCIHVHVLIATLEKLNDKYSSWFVATLKASAKRQFSHYEE